MHHTTPRLASTRRAARRLRAPVMIAIVALMVMVPQAVSAAPWRWT